MFVFYKINIYIKKKREENPIKIYFETLGTMVHSSSTPKQNIRKHVSRSYACVINMKRIVIRKLVSPRSSWPYALTSRPIINRKKSAVYVLKSLNQRFPICIFIGKLSGFIFFHWFLHYFSYLTFVYNMNLYFSKYLHFHQRNFCEKSPCAAADAVIREWAVLLSEHEWRIRRGLLYVSYARTLSTLYGRKRVDRIAPHRVQKCLCYFSDVFSPALIRNWSFGN